MLSVLRGRCCFSHETKERVQQQTFVSATQYSLSFYVNSTHRQTRAFCVLSWEVSATERLLRWLAGKLFKHPPRKPEHVNQ